MSMVERISILGEIDEANVGPILGAVNCQTTRIPEVR